jgi:hypothetical protein
VVTNAPFAGPCAVESTADVVRLDDWLDRLVVAKTLDELKIPATR